MDRSQSLSSSMSWTGKETVGFSNRKFTLVVLTGFSKFVLLKFLLVREKGSQERQLLLNFLLSVVLWS